MSSPANPPINGAGKSDAEYELPLAGFTGTPEEKDRQWFEQCYRGDTQRQLTVRAVIMGGILGMFTSISNLYTTLKIGWGFGASITACIISFVMWNALCKVIRVVSGSDSPFIGVVKIAFTVSVTISGVSGIFFLIEREEEVAQTTIYLCGFIFIITSFLALACWWILRLFKNREPSPMSILENNCMQSTATAAGVSTGTTLATAFGALLLITGVHQPWYVAATFVFFTAALGVFLAIPMKRQMINHEQLRFPSGICTAETLRSLYSRSGESLKQAYSLLVMIGVGAVIGVLHTYRQLADQLKLSNRLPQWFEWLSTKLYLRDEFNFFGFLNPLKHGQMSGLAFEPSVLLVGAGMITGLRVSVTMFAASVLLYYVVAPWLLMHDAANAAVAGYMPAFHLAGNGDFNPIRWALWGGTAVLVFASLMQVALNWRSVMQAFFIFKKEERDALHDAAAAVEVPNSWLFIGMIPITIGVIVVQFFAFHISVWLGLVSVAFSFIASLVCCRSTGETDTAPVGAMGKVTQLLYAVLPGAAGNITTNLMAAGTTGGAGGAAADLLTDLKSGYLLGANPRRQFLAQFYGVFFGVLAVVPAWYLMVPDKKSLEAFNPPATNMWKAVADLLTQGINHLPTTALPAIVIGAIIGMMLPVIEKLWPKAQPYLPSAMGLGLAWVVPFQNSLSFLIGALIVTGWQKWNRKNADSYAIPVASGLVAGESLIAAFIAIACTLVGFMAVR